MKKPLFLLGIVACILFFISCKKDEGKLPNINFIPGSDYTYTSKSLPQGTSFKIGINASKAEDKDVLKKFNISRSTNGAAAVSVFDKDLSGSEGDSYTYDFTGVTDSIPGQTDKYTFTVTNRDGLVNQVNLTLTITE
jgi:hypothetical protein